MDREVDGSEASTGPSPVPGASPAGAGSTSVTHTSGDPTLRFSFRFDDGTWTPFETRATFVTPALAVGEHRLEARARHGANAAHVVCDDPRGAAMGILVGADGRVTMR